MKNIEIIIIIFLFTTRILTDIFIEVSNKYRVTYID